MLVATADIPTRLGDTPELQQSDWAEDSSNPIYGEHTEPYANWMSGTSWTNSGTDPNSPQVTQIVLVYRSSTSAFYSLRRMAPAEKYDSAHLNALAQAQQPVRVDIAYRGSSADEQRVVCAVGNKDTCQVWYAWLRAGQYIIQIRLLSSDQPIDVASFVPVVASVDRTVTTSLAGVTREYPPAASFMFGLYSIIGAFCGFMGIIGLNDDRLGESYFGKMWYGHFSRRSQKPYWSNAALSFGWLTMGLAGISAKMMHDLPFAGWLKWGIFGTLALSSLVCMFAASWLLYTAARAPQAPRASSHQAGPISAS